jgi:hypothetical protein
MSTIKFGLNCLFLVIFFLGLMGLIIYQKFFFKKPKSKPIKPKHPLKTIPKYTKNKLYLSKYYKNPWRKRKKSTKSRPTKQK